MGVRSTASRPLRVKAGTGPTAARRGGEPCRGQGLRKNWPRRRKSARGSDGFRGHDLRRRFSAGIPLGGASSPLAMALGFRSTVVFESPENRPGSGL